MIPVDIHSAVSHNFYGIGKVEKVTADKVYVLFGEKQRIFPYPDAFEKGYLSLVAASTNTVVIPRESSEELIADDIKHHILVIKINQLYEKDMSPDELYGVVRGIWKASKERAEKAEYVFGVYKSLIIAVYKPTEWFVCKDAKDKLPREDIVLSPKNENRIFFVDKSYEQGLPLDDNQKFYFGKSIAKLMMNNRSQNPISYMKPKGNSSTTANIDEGREIILDAADNICYGKIYEAINATAGTNYTGWMKAGWPGGKQEMPFCIWFPKLAETKDGKLVSAAFDCINTISDDWNEVTYEDLKDTSPDIDDIWKDIPILVYAKEPKGGPYIFRGVYVRQKEKSRYKHYVFSRIGTKVKLIGQPADKIVILDDFRKKQ